jgi:ABC-type nickel/cobalt efflux system permease component RcnA
MYEKAAFLFWTTLGLYLVTLFTVTYVGVYLTYIAIPLITFFGLVMLIAKPSKESQVKIDEAKAVTRETSQAISSSADRIGKSMEEFGNQALAASIQMKLDRERCKPIEEKIAKKKDKVLEAISKARLSEISYEDYQYQVNELEDDIKNLESHLILLRSQCKKEAMIQVRERS